MCFLATVDENRVVHEPRAVARGSFAAVLVAARDAPEGGVMLHNHPSGDLEPSLKAFDAWSGELLWRAQLDAPPSSSIVTYQVGDKQYLAVLVGIDNLHIGGMTRAYQAVAAKTEVPEAPPKGGPAIWVFALQAGTN